MNNATSVLIIEDNQQMAEMVQYSLRTARNTSFLLHTCATLADGIAYLKDNRVDVVLLDLTLPDSNGLETVDDMRAHLNHGTPIVVMTGISDPGQGLKAAAHGVQDYLIKGRIDSQQILQSIQYAVERKRASDEMAKANRAFRLLSKVNKAANRSSDDFDILFQLCHIIVKEGGYELAWVGGPEPPTNTQSIVPRAWAVVESDNIDQVNATWADEKHGIGPISQAIQQRQPRVYHTLDGGEDAEAWQQAALESGYRSILALPLLLGDEIIGGLAVYAEEENAFDADEVSLMTELLDDVAFSIAAYRLRAAQEETERALRESEVRYRTLFDNVPAGIYRSSPDGKLLEANRALVEMLGFPNKQALLNTNVANLYLTPEARKEHVARLVRRDELQGQPVQLRRYDGKIIWVEDTTRVVRNYNKDILWYEGELRDITDQRMSEIAEIDQRQFAEALSDIAMALNSTLNLDEVLDRILTAVERVAPHDAANIFMNVGGVARLVRSHGYMAEELWKHPEQFEYAIAETPNLRWIAENREPLIINDIRQYPGWIKGKVTDWIRSTIGLPVEFNGELIGFITLDSKQPGVFLATHASRLQAFAHQAAVAMQNAQYFQNLKSHRDDLEQVALQSTIELQQTLERMETILSNTPDSILLLNPEGQIEVSNPAFWQLFGYDSNKASRLSLLDLAAPDQRPRLYNALSLVSREHQTARLELVVRTQAGALFDVELALAPVLERDKVLSVVASLRDITQLKEVERIKDAFISMAAHELRTPLTSIRGFSEILLHWTLEPERSHQYLQYIHEQSEQLSMIIEDLLDLSRLRSGKGMGLKPATVEIADLLQEVIEPLSEVIDAHPIAQVGLADLPPIMADRLRLAQVFRNLLSNAAKFSPKDAPITISGELTDSDVLIAIRDEGIGMTDEQKVLAFDPFYRVDTTNTAPEGTGLGLSICQMIVEEHGGDIHVESAPGKGSTFTIRLPRQQD